ncbi:MAG TPA: HAD hydrolase-like protein [Candidatus Angelobacter sp.]
MATLVSSTDDQPAPSSLAYVRSGFCWNAGDAYLFDIDGTLLNSRDAVHYFAFHHAVRQVFRRDVKIDGVPVHGNTDIGILRAVLRRDGFADAAIDAGLPQMIAHMCAAVERNSEQMRPELCPSICDLLSRLQEEGKLLGTATGNLETVGWLKLEKAGLRQMFSFGSFCFPLEHRADILMHGVELARERRGSRTSVYVIGDTPADIEAARHVNAPVIAVATGTYRFEDLLACRPDACFGCGTDMLNY